MDDCQLLNFAQEARLKSYAPYSEFTVGAALLTFDNKVYLGCNIENKSFSPTNCAERTAFFKAISDGHRQFQAIAIVGGKKGDLTTEPCLPCGVCLQVMSEFCDAKQFRIIVVDPDKGSCSYFLQDLLPAAFTGPLGR